jgi:hypothetical protein
MVWLWWMTWSLRADLTRDAITMSRNTSSVFRVRCFISERGIQRLDPNEVVTDYHKKELGVA